MLVAITGDVANNNEHTESCAIQHVAIHGPNTRPTNVIQMQFQ
jgi:hypothetical protein